MASMMMNIDRNKLSDLAARPNQPATAHELRRDGSVFFVGGNLPINETLVTMFDSFCTESTDLFYLTFGDTGGFNQGVEMARQIKKNFHVRLMGRLDYAPSLSLLERTYAAGVDILDIPVMADERSLFHWEGLEETANYKALLAARSIFPRWGVASSLPVGDGSRDSVVKFIDVLLRDGIVPLVSLAGRGAAVPQWDLDAIFKHLAAGWERYDVPVKQYLPWISLMTPLTAREQGGVFRSLIDKFQDRRLLAASDLRRHLRVKQAEDSMDSAAL